MENDRPERTDDDGPTFDGLVRVLCDQDRRIALFYLLEHERATVDELADVISGWTHAAEGTVATPADRTRVVASLRSVHLPLLEDSNLVRSDPQSGEVQLSTLSGQYRTFVEWCAAVETRLAPSI